MRFCWYILQCVLATSDLQLVTGLSIIISGYVQLRSGISTYHFLFIVYLAYFSTLTHLSCLTIMRQYLHKHKVERVWRLLGMAILVVLLVVGLVFTGNYGWAIDYSDGRPAIGDFAFCYLRFTPRADLAFVSMIVSVLLVSIAFISRVIKLHDFFSTQIVGSLRKWASTQSRKALRVVYNWCDVKSSSLYSVKRTLFYRPLLALLLLLRILVDACASAILEVSHSPAYRRCLLLNG